MENYNNYDAYREASEQESIRQNEQRAQEQAQQLQEQKAQEQKEQERKALEEKAQEQKEQEQKAQEQKAEEQKAQEQKHQEELKEREPVRPEQHYGEQRYAQGSGDYVSETTAALKNDHMINSGYYASLQENEAADRDMTRDAVEHDVTKEQTAGAQEEETVTRDEEVSKLADDYAAAHPDSGATQDELYEAAYFAKSVEDSEKYPPLNEDMKNQVEDRQATEEIGDNLREVSDERMERSDEEQQELMQERMQTHMSHQHSASMA